MAPGGTIQYVNAFESFFLIICVFAVTLEACLNCKFRRRMSDFLGPLMCAVQTMVILHVPGLKELLNFIYNIKCTKLNMYLFSIFTFQFVGYIRCIWHSSKMCDIKRSQRWPTHILF